MSEKIWKQKLKTFLKRSQSFKGDSDDHKPRDPNIQHDVISVVGIFTRRGSVKNTMQTYKAMERATRCYKCRTTVESLKSSWKVLDCKCKWKQVWTCHALVDWNYTSRTTASVWDEQNEVMQPKQGCTAGEPTTNWNSQQERGHSTELYPNHHKGGSAGTLP